MTELEMLDMLNAEVVSHNVSIGNLIKAQMDIMRKMVNDKIKEITPGFLYLVNKHVGHDDLKETICSYLTTCMLDIVGLPKQMRLTVVSHDSIEDGDIKVMTVDINCIHGHIFQFKIVVNNNGEIING